MEVPLSPDWLLVMSSRRMQWTRSVSTTHVTCVQAGWSTVADRTTAHESGTSRCVWSRHSVRPIPYRPAVACSAGDGIPCFRGALPLDFVDADDLEADADEQDEDEDP
jgi:hypothetical protein